MDDCCVLYRNEFLKLMIRLVFQAARSALEEVEGKYSEARAILDEVYIYMT